MYEQYFAFKRPPFSIAPDPSFLYPSPQHRDGLEQLLYGLKKEGGFIVLTGEVGTGKTTLCRLFIKELPPNVHSATVLNAKLNTDDLLSNICKELGVQCDTDTASVFQKTEAITELLHRNHKAAKRTLLIIEEAQNLNPDALETLRLFTNIETDTTKLLHILLIGQPELAATLGRPDLRQLAQRIIARYHLQPLSREETQNYITHRLSVAGGQNNVFKKAAVTALYETSGGIPRLINLIADRSLLNVFNEKTKHANANHVRSAAALISGNTGTVPSPTASAVLPRYWWLFGLVVLFILGLFIYLQIAPKQAVEPAAAPTAKAAVVPNKTNSAPEATPTAEPNVAAISTAINLEAELLTLWQVDTSNMGELCSHAQAKGLQCLNLERQSLEDIRSYNRPAMLTIFGETGQAEAALLTSINSENAFQLLGKNGAYTLSKNDFELRWRGDIKLLWQAAPGYIDSLYVGDKSFQTVYWLQESLNTLGLVNGKVITGGVFTSLLSDHVKTIQGQAQLSADGILGKRTIMAINTQLGRVPTLSPLQQSP